MKLVFAFLLILSAPAFAFQDFKRACGIPRSIPISQRNYAENMIQLQSLDGTRLCWIAKFTLKDGAINEITCWPVRCDSKDN